MLSGLSLEPPPPASAPSQAMDDAAIDELTGFLDARIGVVTRPVPLDGGNWSTALRFSSGDAELVVRVGGSADDYARDRLATGWAGPTLPIPDFVDAGVWRDAPFAITRFVVGEPLDRLDADGWSGVLDSLTDALAALGSVELGHRNFGPFHPDGSAPWATTADWLADRFEQGPAALVGWADRLAEHPDVAACYWDTVARIAAHVAVVPTTPRPVHTDLGAGNTLVAGGRVAAVIDWGNAAAGDPAADVATLTFWAPWHGDCPEARLRAQLCEPLAGDHVVERVALWELVELAESLRWNAWRATLGDVPALLGRAEALGL